VADIIVNLARSHSGVEAIKIAALQAMALSYQKRST
jgi:hypothetical protein